MPVSLPYLKCFYFRLAFFFVCLFISNQSFSQQPGLLINKSIGGTFLDFYYGLFPYTGSRQSDIFKANDGSGYVSIINTQASDQDITGHHGNFDIWVARLDDHANIVWQKALGGSGDDTFTKAIYHLDGSMTIFGTTNSTDGDVTGLHGKSDIWVIRLSNAGDIVWQKTLGGSEVEEMRSVDELPDGSFVVAALTRSINGDVLGNHGDQDIWVAKLSATGAIQWKKCYGGSSDDYAKFIQCQADGNFIISGTTGSTDGDITNHHGYNDVWLIKINSTGGIIWQKTFGGSGHDPGQKFVISNTGSIVVLATTESSDKDVSGFHGATDVWIANIDYNNGGLLWQKCIGGSGMDTDIDILKLPDGSFTIAAFTDSRDGDASNSHGSTDILIANINGTGAVQWTRCYGGSGREFSSRPTFEYNSTDNAYYLSAVSGSNDGDVIGMHWNLNSSPTTDLWVVKLGLDGSIIWQKCIGGSVSENPLASRALGNDRCIVIGQTSSEDGDLLYNTSAGRIMISLLGPVNVIKGYEFADMNRNGIKDTAEPFSDWIVETSKSGYTREMRPFGSNGQFRLEVDSGTFNTRVVAQNPYYDIIPVTHQSVFPGYNSVDSITFALQPQPGKRDLTIDVVPVNPARPGFNMTYKLFYRNAGTDTVLSGSIVFKKDPRLNFISAMPPVSSSTGDSLKWNFSNLKPFDTVSFIQINLQVQAPPNVNINDTLTSIAHISPVAGDLTPSDDTIVFRQRVVGSFDPNDKSENYAGKMPLRQLNSGKYIHYLVRFQNFGTDTAFSITIRDTLDGKLDWNSFEITGASHPYFLHKIGQNKIKVLFPDVKLVNSSTNEPASHGYIAYRIKPNVNLSIGDTIRNSASIYFDYNLSVETNTQETIVTSDVAITPVPTITSFTPITASSGTSVTITGTNFTGATAVSFGGTAATSFTVNSATSITAVVGAGASGNVSVTTAGGTSTLAGFTFIPAPTITSFTPASGGTAASITITGTNFTGATAVSFGGTAATSFTVNSATSITAVVGAGASGSVSVTTPGGTATLAGFTFTVVTAIDPVPANSLGIRFYPNPTTGSFVIDTLKLADKWETLEIFDTQGKKKLSNFNIRNKTRVTVNIEYLSNGLYMAILKRKSGPAAVIKFLKL